MSYTTGLKENCLFLSPNSVRLYQLLSSVSIKHDSPVLLAQTEVKERRMRRTGMSYIIRRHLRGINPSPAQSPLQAPHTTSRFLFNRDSSTGTNSRDSVAYVGS
jgi:hypothetical protein